MVKGLQSVKVLVNWGPFGNFFEKISQCRKKLKKGDPSVSPGIECYAEKIEKLF